MFKIYKYRDFPEDEEKVIAEAQEYVEERFVLWFSEEKEIPTTRINRHDALVFSGSHTIEEVEDIIEKAYERFQTVFSCSQVPDVVGLMFSEASKKITNAGLLWTLDSEAPSDKYPKGAVIWQSPTQGVTASPDLPMRLVLSNGQKEHEPAESKRPERIEDDDVFKQFLS